MTTKEMAEKNYKRGLWTVEMLAALVKAAKLSPADFQEICGESYEAQVK